MKNIAIIPARSGSKGLKDKNINVNGCIYINKIDDINENTSFNDNRLGFIMDRSHSVDIDEYKDIVKAEYYLSKRDFSW